ncbi:MAG: 2-amino-4-hydroxy-6-hydroxymethyldihydropteridine diphosphokinase [Rhodospirillales bacterium]|jgi:2-amino-4-hydroxy-6-hydroxymethyldihydropteridine diphosphokinase
MIFIGIGSNLPSEKFGAPQAVCEAAVNHLAQNDIEVLRRSSWYETAPIPASQQPNYVNGVVSIGTNLDSLKLLDLLLDVESRMGRERYFSNAARIIDLDLLAYNDEIVDTERLCLPHPRLEDRAFVVQPILEIAPDWQHPHSRRSIQEILENLSEQEITRIPT